MPRAAQVLIRDPPDRGAVDLLDQPPGPRRRLGALLRPAPLARPEPLARGASSAVAKNATFSRFGFLAGQVGRQKIPVVFTATTNTPS